MEFLFQLEREPIERKISKKRKTRKHRALTFNLNLEATKIA